MSHGETPYRRPKGLDRSHHPGSHARHAAITQYVDQCPNSVKHTSGNTMTNSQSKSGTKGITERTVEKIEPNDGTIRNPPEVDRFTLPNNRISQRDKVANSRTRPNVLQVRSRGTVHTTLAEIFVLQLGRFRLRVQFLEASFVESSRNCLVDVCKHSVVPIRRIFCGVIEDVDISGAGYEPRSIQSHSETCTRKL